MCPTPARLDGIPRRDKQLAAATVAENVATTCLDVVAGSWMKSGGFQYFQLLAARTNSGQVGRNELLISRL